MTLPGLEDTIDGDFGKAITVGCVFRDLETRCTRTTLASDLWTGYARVSEGATGNGAFFFDPASPSHMGFIAPWVETPNMPFSTGCLGVYTNPPAVPAVWHVNIMKVAP